MEDFVVCYTNKDLILYALSLGMGSKKDDSNELKFLYEEHDKFTAVPTFAFALTFWAAYKGNNIGTTTNTTTQGIPPFPPPLMASEDVIPRRFLRETGNGNGNSNAIDISNFPVIHTWQSIVWHQSIAVSVPLSHNNNKQTRKGTMIRRQTDQIKTNINLETISVQPKSIGTFITSQSKVTSIGNNDNQLLCTMQSTALVLGVDSNNVIAFDAGIQRLTSNKPKIPSTSNTKKPIFHWIYQTSQSQALLYRMTSGDSNHIHVDTSASDMLGSDTKAPLLHGLFTLALAFRAIIKLIDGTYNSSLDIDDDDDDYEIIFRRLEGKFKSPAFVGDCLCVKVWNDETKKSANDNTKSFLFVITNHVTGKKLVDYGHAEVEIVSKLSSTKKSRL
jgi:acyl dehydratase